jgi:hypothetical protein
MNSEMLTRWTAILTNIAVLIGLLFVGLEFRNNTRALEAERIDSLTQGMSEINNVILGDTEFAEIFYQSFKNPESLQGSSLDRVQHLMISSYNNFQSVHLAHQAGLISDEIYEVQRVGVGFAFSSEVGLDLIEIMRVSTMGESLWDVVKVSAEHGKAYCMNPKNRCVSRYEAARHID